MSLSSSSSELLSAGVPLDASDGSDFVIAALHESVQLSWFGVELAGANNGT